MIGLPASPTLTNTTAQTDTDKNSSSGEGGGTSLSVVALAAGTADSGARSGWSSDVLGLLSLMMVQPGSRLRPAGPLMNGPQHDLLGPPIAVVEAPAALLGQYMPNDLAHGASAASPASASSSRAAASHAAGGARVEVMRSLGLAMAVLGPVSVPAQSNDATGRWRQLRLR